MAELADELVATLHAHYAGYLMLMTDPAESPNAGGLNFAHDDEAGWVFVVWPDLVAFHSEALHPELRQRAFVALAKWGEHAIGLLDADFDRDDAIIAAGDQMSDEDLALLQFIFDE